MISEVVVLVLITLGDPFPKPLGHFKDVGWCNTNKQIVESPTRTRYQNN
jgi:hypothetical protein